MYPLSSAKLMIIEWETHKAAGWAAVAMVWLFVIHFGYSWGPCAWIIVAEIWPLSNRPYGIALGASSNWMNNFIVGQVKLHLLFPFLLSHFLTLTTDTNKVTPDMISGISYGTYLIFGILTYLGAAFVWVRLISCLEYISVAVRKEKELSCKEI
jgi:hypothetical protein